MFFDNRQESSASGVNVGGEVILYALRPRFDAAFAALVTGGNGSGIGPAIAIYDEAGQRLAVNDDASPSGSSSLLVSQLVAGQRCTLAVTSYDDATTGAYVDDVAAQLGDDSHEDDDTQRQSTAVPPTGTRAGILADERDSYAIVLAGTGPVGSSASIEFDHDLGDVDFTLLDRRGREIARSEGTTDRETVSLAGLPAGRLLKTSNGVANVERVSLAGRPAGTYYLKVYGYGGAANPSYSLRFN